jgi:hypothetical protein
MAQNQNSNNKNTQSGVVFTFRLSETLVAVILTAGLSFGGGFVLANSNHNQNVNNCSVQNIPTNTPHKTR